jgi:hypothetical protein
MAHLAMSFPSGYLTYAKSPLLMEHHPKSSMGHFPQLCSIIHDWLVV